MEDLFVLGKLLPTDKRAVAVVGSRKMTPRGMELTKKYVKELVKEKITIVSGLARGIDTIAHITALENGGRTIAVLGSGLDIIYPPENKELAERITKSGCLISGFPYDTKPEGKNFLARNRIIVKLSLAVLVIELSTASHAGNDGVEVFAIPGSEACDYLIDNGATVANSPKDVIKYLKQIESI